MARKQGVFWSYILMVSEMLSSVLFTPFLIRTFGQAEYGIYSLVASITAYLALLDLGVGNAIVRYMAKFRVLREYDRQRNLLTVTLLFYCTVSVVVIVIGSVLKYNMSLIFGKGLTYDQIERAKQMFSITVLNMAATLILASFDKTIIAFEKFVFQKILAIVKIFIRVTVSVIVLLCGGKGVAIVAVNFSMTLLFGVISILYVVIKLCVWPKFKGIDISFIKEIIGYSAFIFIQMVATQINSMVDHILIGVFVGSSAVILAVYSVGAQINQYFQSMASGINGVLMPGVVGMVENSATSDQLLSEMVRIGRILFMFLGLVWCVFVVMGDEFIILWAGELNKQAYWVACILITPTMFALVQSIGGQILWAINKHKVQAYLKIIVSVINIFFTILLIKWNPVIGASLGTAIAITIGDVVVMNIVFTHDIGISMKQYYVRLFKGILPSVVITLITGIIIKITINPSGWIGLILCCIAMVIIFTVLMYIKGMNRYEKGLVDDIVKKLRLKE